MPETQVTGWPRGLTGFEQRYGNAVTRVVTAVVGIPIVFGALWLGGWPFFLFTALLASGTLVEFYWLTQKQGARPEIGLGVTAGIFLMFGFMHGFSDALMVDLLGSTPVLSEMTMAVSMLMARFIIVTGVLLLFVISVLIAGMRRTKGNPILDNTATIAGVTYVSLFLAALVGLRQLFTGDPATYRYLQDLDPALLTNLDQYGALTVFGVLLAIWSCDSAAYFAGKAFGRRKLFERVSPKKTWEGSIAGALAAVLVMLGLRAWFLEYLTLFDALIIGLIVGVFGQIGDLAESHLKRNAGVKDSSLLIPGHGGLFDRLDSLLFVAPLTYLYLNLVVLLG